MLRYAYITCLVLLCRALRLALAHTQSQREGGPSPPHSAEVENDWSYAATQPYALFINHKGSDDGLLRVTWQFLRYGYCLLFRNEYCISESGSAPVHKWKGGEVRIHLGPLESM